MPKDNSPRATRASKRLREQVASNAGLPAQLKKRSKKGEETSKQDSSAKNVKNPGTSQGMRQVRDPRSLPKPIVEVPSVKSIRRHGSAWSVNSGSSVMVGASKYQKAAVNAAKSDHGKRMVFGACSDDAQGSPAHSSVSTHNRGGTSPVYFGEVRAQRDRSPDVRFSPLLARAEASSSASLAHIKKLEAHASGHHLFTPTGKAHPSSVFRLRSALEPDQTYEHTEVSSPIERTREVHPQPLTMSATVHGDAKPSRPPSLYAHKSRKDAATTSKSFDPKRPPPKRLSTREQEILDQRGVQLYTYFYPPDLPPPTVEVPVQLGRTVPSGPTWYAATVGVIEPRPKKYHETGYEQFTSFRMPATRIWYLIPPTHYCRQLAQLGASSSDEVRAAWSAGNRELRIIREEYGIKDMPTPDPPSQAEGEGEEEEDMDEERVLSDDEVGRDQAAKEVKGGDGDDAGAVQDGASTDSGSNYSQPAHAQTGRKGGKPVPSDGSDTDDSDDSDRGTAPQTGKRKSKKQHQPTKASKRKRVHHRTDTGATEEPPRPTKSLPRLKTGVHEAAPSSPLRLTAAQKGKGRALPGSRSLSPPLQASESQAPVSSAQTQDSSMLDAKSKGAGKGIRFSRAGGNSFNWFQSFWSDQPGRPETIGGEAFVKQAREAYNAIPPEQQEREKHIWKVHYDRKHGAIAFDAPADMVAEGKDLLKYLKTLTKFYMQTGKDIVAKSNGGIQVVTLITSQNPIARQGASIITTEASLMEFIDTHNVEISGFIDNVSNVIFAVQSGLINPEALTSEQIAKCFSMKAPSTLVTGALQSSKGSELGSTSANPEDRASKSSKAKDPAQPGGSRKEIVEGDAEDNDESAAVVTAQDDDVVMAQGRSASRQYYDHILYVATGLRNISRKWGEGAPPLLILHKLCLIFPRAQKYQPGDKKWDPNGFSTSFNKNVAKAHKAGEVNPGFRLVPWSDDEKKIPKHSSKYQDIPIVKDIDGITVTRTVSGSVLPSKEEQDAIKREGMHLARELENTLQIEKPLEVAKFRSTAMKVIENNLKTSKPTQLPESSTSGAGSSLNTLTEALNKWKKIKISHYPPSQLLILPKTNHLRASHATALPSENKTIYRLHSLIMVEPHPDKDAPLLPSQNTIPLEVALHQGSLPVVALLIAKVLTEKIFSWVIIDRKDFFDILEFAPVIAMASPTRIMVLIIIVKAGLVESHVPTDILYATHPTIVDDAPLPFTMNIALLVLITIALVLAIMVLVLGIIALIQAHIESTTSQLPLLPIILVKCSSIG